MPNQPRADNPVRYVRVEDALWQRAQARADRDGVKVSAVVRAALEEYVEGVRVSIQVNMSERDARFCIEHLRHLADRETPKDADHAAACLSARWLAGQIEDALGHVSTPTPAPPH